MVSLIWNIENRIDVNGYNQTAGFYAFVGYLKCKKLHRMHPLWGNI